MCGCRCSKAGGLARTLQRGALSLVGGSSLPRCSQTFWACTCSFQQDPAGPLCPPQAWDSRLGIFRLERDNWGLEGPPNQTFPSRRCSEPWSYGIRLRLSGMRQRTLGPPCSYASEDTQPLTGSQPHSRQLPFLWADYSGRETSALKGCSGSAPFPTALLTHTLWKPPRRG